LAQNDSAVARPTIVRPHTLAVRPPLLAPHYLAVRAPYKPTPQTLAVHHAQDIYLHKKTAVLNAPQFFIYY